MAEVIKGRTVTLPEAIWDKLKAAAEADRRSVNAQILVILEAALNADPAKVA